MILHADWRLTSIQHLAEQVNVLLVLDRELFGTVASWSLRLVGCSRLGCCLDWALTGRTTVASD
jgi:hypothetical protein